MALSLTLILPSPLTLEEIDWIESWLRETCFGLETMDASWLAWIARLPSFQTRPLRKAHPFRLSLGIPLPQEAHQVSMALGSACEQTILIEAHQETMQDHLALAHLGLGLSRHLKGWIALSGELYPGDGVVRTEAERRLFFSQFPGRIEEIAREGEDFELEIEHACDARFLESWMQHPAFMLPRFSTPHPDLIAGR